MEEKEQKKIKFINLIVLILVILIIAAIVIGMIVKGKRHQERIEQYQKQFETTNHINTNEGE